MTTQETQRIIQTKVPQPPETLVIQCDVTDRDNFKDAIKVGTTLSCNALTRKGCDDALPPPRYPGQQRWYAEYKLSHLYHSKRILVVLFSNRRSLLMLSSNPIRSHVLHANEEPHGRRLEENRGRCLPGWVGKEKTVQWNWTNGSGVLNGIGGVLDGMLKRGSGHIINISSDAGRKVAGSCLKSLTISFYF